MKDTFTTTGRLRIGDPEKTGYPALVNVKPGTYAVEHEPGKRIPGQSRFSWVEAVHADHVGAKLDTIRLSEVTTESGNVSIDELSFDGVSELNRYQGYVQPGCVVVYRFPVELLMDWHEAVGVRVTFAELTHD